MLQRIKIFAILLISFFVVKVGNAQTDSYIPLKDPSGLCPTVNEILELEKATDSLVADLPITFQGQFKVIEGAFYPILGSTAEGIEDSYSKLKAIATNESEYYLLIIKDYSQGATLQWRLDVKLPESACFTSSKISILKYNLSKFLDEKTNSSLQIINHAAFLISDIIDCCESRSVECSPEKDVLDFLGSKDFIELKDNNYSLSSEKTNIPNIGQSYSIYYQRDGANIDFTDELSDYSLEMNQYGDVQLAVNVLKTASDMEDFLSDYAALDTTGKYYTDEIVVVLTENGYRCYGKFHHSFENNTLALNGDQIQQRALPVLVVWLLKRAAMAGIGVFAHVAISVSIEKYIGGLETWDEAWLNSSFTTLELAIAAFNGATADKIWLSILGSALIGTINDVVKIPADQLTWNKVFGAGFENALIATITTIGGNLVGKAGTAMVKYISKGGSKYLKINSLFLKSPEFRNSIYGSKLIKSLQKVTPSNSSNRISTSDIASFGKKVPMYSSELTTLMNQLRNSTNVNEKGEIAEKICEKYYRECGYNLFIKKLNNSGHGLDMIAYKGTLSNPKDVIILEAKKISNSNGIQLGKISDSPNKGAQMSHNWIKNNLNGLYDITSENEKLFIEYCGKNHSNLPRMVTAINETTQELIMVNLSKF